MPRPVSPNGRLVERLDLSDSLAVFRIRPDEMPGTDAPWFRSGQYVSLGLNAPDGSEGVLRPYSIASAPEERRWLEFYIRRITRPDSGRPFTHLLWRLPPGDRLFVGPRIAGRFTLEATVGAADPRLKVCAAAGTGVAPFVSLVRSTAARGDAPALARIAVLHGASHAHELGYRDELARALGDRFVATVSRPADNPAWTGAVGRVESFFDPERLPELERLLGLPQGGFSPDAAVVYVCGFTGTIAETVFRLIRRGYVPEERRLRRLLEIPDASPPSLFFEQYDTEPIVDPADRARLEELRSAFRAHVRP